MLETTKNMIKAFVGESQARNRYTMYAKAAEKEGFIQVSDVFLLTAENEREHAKWFFRMLQDVKKEETEDIDELMINVPADLKIGNTKENLLDAIKGEHEENSGIYPEFAKVAEDEGFPDIAARIRSISKAEEHHEERYTKLLDVLENNTVFKKPDKRYWVCRQCGYVHDGNEPPEKCPSCSHPKNYFSVLCEIF
ncbi:MAG: rubrerythrin family protein [Candidatus Aenigmarchaeota archaeon]|nr:rubrerythrin family protein [Candidatus Aenigmarchaeota archaeon]